MQVSAVVVSYNAASELARCLETLHANGVTDIVVVDNGSSDESEAVSVEAKARWMETGSNLGYGRAANQGVSALDADAVLICNPDLTLDDGAVCALAAALDADERLGLVGPRLRNIDGTIYPSARQFPSLADALGHGLLGLVAPGNRHTRRYRMLDWDHAAAARVDWVSGACMLVRRRAWDDVAGFDPGYFMYLEDVDLCWRLRQAGWEVGYDPAAEATHVQGVSARAHPYRMLLAHHRSLWRFARRTLTGPRRALLPLIGIGLAARFGVACAEHWRGSPRAERAARIP